MIKTQEKILIKHALNCREKAFVPFSDFRVGAALLCKGGKIYTGCNIENFSLGLSICAERVALVKAISEGDMCFQTIVIVADTKSLTYPCGACRQMIWEFSHSMQIILANLKGDIKRFCISDLLPHAFDFHLEQGCVCRDNILDKRSDKKGSK